MSKKIIEIWIKNYKGVEDQHLVLNSKSFYVIGPNNMGKTTITDAAFTAIGAQKPAPMPIMEGKDKAKITVAIGEGQTTELIVEKVFTPGNLKGKLVVKNADGSIHPSPQKMLDDALGTKFLDMEKIMNSKSEKDMLKALSEFLGVDTDAIDAEYQTLFEERTTINREVKKYKELVEANESEDPGEVPEMGELLEKQKKLDQTKAQLNSFNEVVNNGKAFIQATELEIAKRKQSILDLEAQIQTLKAFNTSDEEKLGKARDKVKLNEASANDAMIEIEKFGDVVSQIAGISSKQSQKAAWNTHLQNKAELAKYEKQSEERTEKLDAIKQKKSEAFEKANLPNIKIENDSITYKGLPLSKLQINSAGLATLAADIIIAQNSPFKFVKIDVSMMDKANREETLKKLHEAGLQVGIEQADTQGTFDDVQIEVLED